MMAKLRIWNLSMKRLLLLRRTKYRETGSVCDVTGNNRFVHRVVDVRPSILI